MTTKPNGTHLHDEEHSCAGIVREARERSEARRNKPQPWITRKFAIFMAIGFIGYAWYVYVGRLCVPMIRRDAGALGSRGMGIAFLVVFCMLGLLMLWAYEKLVFTSPGLAKHHVHKSPAPDLKNNVYPTWFESESEADLAAARFQSMQNPPQSGSPSQPEPTHHTSRHRRDGSRFVYQPSEKQENGHASLSNGHASVPSHDENAGVTDALPPVAAARAKVDTNGVRPPRPSHQSRSASGSGPSSQKPSMYTRKPSQTPILLPQYRYCHKDGFQKPMRAHHCRACGTCVLRYDHHCPWIGQCVGARNHRFFLIFVFWATLFCVWTFATLIGLTARASRTRPNFEVDGQKIAIIALSGFFSIFTIALLVTHTILISSNMTTVEQLGKQRMREREKRVLGRLHAWWHLRAKSATKKEWDAEWGRINQEGHIWWLGSARKNWELTMGDRVWMWFLPIGKSPDDGLSYEVNPRFDAEGRWLPRSQWPAHLR